MACGYVQLERNRNCNEDDLLQHDRFMLDGYFGVCTRDKRDRSEGKVIVWKRKCL